MGLATAVAGEEVVWVWVVERAQRVRVARRAAVVGRMSGIAVVLIDGNGDCVEN